jgi:hypothetical protein
VTVGIMPAHQGTDVDMVRIMRSRAVVGGAVALALGAATLVAAPGAQALAVNPVVTKLLTAAAASQAALGPRLDVSTSESLVAAVPLFNLTDRWVGDFGTGRYRRTITGTRFDGSSTDGFTGSSFYAAFTPTGEEQAGLRLLGKPRARIVIDTEDTSAAIMIASFAKSQTPAAMALSLDPARGLDTITSISESTVGSTDSYALSVEDTQASKLTVTFTVVSGFMTAAHLEIALPAGNAANVNVPSRLLSPKSDRTPTAQALVYAARLRTKGVAPHLVVDITINGNGSGVVVPGAIAGQSVHAIFLVAAVNRLRRETVTRAVANRAKRTTDSINLWARKNHRRVTVADIKVLAGVTTSTYALLLIKKGVRMQRTYSPYTGDDLPSGGPSVSGGSGSSSDAPTVARCIVPDHQRAIIVKC